MGTLISLPPARGCSKAIKKKKQVGTFVVHKERPPHVRMLALVLE